MCEPGPLYLSYASAIPKEYLPGTTDPPATITNRMAGDLVFRNVRGGRLYQGGALDARLAVAAARKPNDAVLAPHKVDVLVCCATWPEYHMDEALLPEHLKGFRVELHDRPLGPVEEEHYRAVARKLGAAIAAEVREGKCALVTCAAGLNRSGLVTGFTLRALGLDGDRAVRAIRAARSPSALSNASFAKLVRKG